MIRYLAVLAVLALLLMPQEAWAQNDARVRAAVRAYAQAHDVEIVRDLATFLSIPNLASDSVNIRRNAQHLMGLLQRRGASPRLLELPGSPPAVFGELPAPGATRTVVFYAHYDGQPVDTSQWATPPWTPTLRTGVDGQIIALPTTPGAVRGEWRMYARSAGDDKSPIIAFLSALDALRAAKIAPSVNIKFFFEGEEEAGSPHLRPMLTRYRDLLGADAWIFGDGPIHPSRREEVVFGVRGSMGLELTTYGPARALHSGHYGNWAPNPLVAMANLIASVRDNDGRILIEHFYDDVRPITAAERAAIAGIPAADSALRDELQLGASEANNALLAERIMLPALNVRGISGGNVGALAANAIATVAYASIDFRLVPGQTPERVRELFEAHARKQGYLVTHTAPTREERLAHARILRLDWEPGYPAQRADMSLPVSRAVVRAVALGTGEPPIVLPTSGASAGLYHFDEVLHAPLISVPIANHDDNQHAANENVRLQNVFDGMQVYAAIVAHLDRLWSVTP